MENSERESVLAAAQDLTALLARVEELFRARYPVRGMIAVLPPAVPVPGKPPIPIGFGWCRLAADEWRLVCERRKGVPQPIGELQMNERFALLQHVPALARHLDKHMVELRATITTSTATLEGFLARETP